MSVSSLFGIVLASQGGLDVLSDRPKSLYVLCGKPLGAYGLGALSGVGVAQSVVVCDGASGMVAKRLSEAHGITNSEPRFSEATNGELESVEVGLNNFHDLTDDGDVLIIRGDLPMLSDDDLYELVARHRESGAACTVASTEVTEQSAKAIGWLGIDHFCRQVTDKSGKVIRLERGPVDLNHDVGSQISLGAYCVKRELLPAAIRGASQLGSKVSDIVEVIADYGHLVVGAHVGDPTSFAAVRTLRQLATSESVMRQRINGYWMSKGVTMVDPKTTYIDWGVSIAPDTTLFPNTHLKGKCEVGSDCELGPDVSFEACRIGDGVKASYCVGSMARVGDNARLGPFVSLEPGAEVKAGSVAHGVSNLL